jgi:hypothetical protein
MVVVAQRGAGRDCSYVDAAGVAYRMLRTLHPARHGAYFLADNAGVEPCGISARHAR